MNRIFLLSGAVHSGKTTRLTNWIKDKDRVDGILQPVIDGKRYIKRILSGKIRPLESSKELNLKDLITIGNYNFSTESFNWARNQLILSFQINPEWLIIDEYGKLEMDNKGLEPVVSKLFYETMDCQKMNLVFVVRDYIVSDFLKKFNLSEINVNTLEV